jgi:hypothetical protein
MRRKSFNLSDGDLFLPLQFSKYILPFFEDRCPEQITGVNYVFLLFFAFCFQKEVLLSIDAFLPCLSKMVELIRPIV